MKLDNQQLTTFSQCPKHFQLQYDDTIRQTFKRAHRNQQIKDWIIAVIILAAMLLFVNIIWQA